MRRLVPFLLLGVGLLAATSPVWRPLLFAAPLTIDDILSFRCG